MTLLKRIGCVCAVWCCIGAWPVAAQQLLRWIDYTNTWRFEQSGSNLGTAWRDPGFDDSSWASGAGLFGYETNVPPPYPVPFHTTLQANATLITYYFRTTFELAEVPAALARVEATVYADDACAVYLNGIPVGQARIGANPAFDTRAASSPPYEGYGDIFIIDPATVRAGTNVLAVEVHQSQGSTYDVVFGLKLRATLADPLQITRQPADQTVVAGQTNTFSVELSGGPATFQWFKDNTPIVNATNRSLTLANVTTNQAGVYVLIASNVLGATISDPARLTVLAAPPTVSLDFTGPRLVGASRSNTNFVDVQFSERITPPPPTAFHIESLPDGTSIPILGLVNSGSFVRIRVAGDYWMTNITARYLVTVNGVRDTSAAQNVVPPNSQVGIESSWQLPLFPLSQIWSCHSTVLDDPSVLEGRWFDPDYMPSPFWISGPAPFVSTTGGDVTCAGPAMTRMPFQLAPILFRTTFTNDVPHPGTLVLSGVNTDGLVVYLNGEEIYRFNLPAFPKALTVDTRAVAVQPIFCSVRRLSNIRLRLGTNHLACAVYQYASGSSFDPSSTVAAFGLAASFEYTTTPALPPAFPPQLETRILPGPGAGRLQLSWTGGGFALEGTTNLNLGPGSYPNGPWTEVRAMSNPYTNTLDGPAQFFRLKQ